MPRIAKNKINRDNTETDGHKTYYRKVFAIRFIDDLISENELRFTKLSYSVSRVFLIPIYIYTEIPTSHLPTSVSRTYLTKIYLTELSSSRGKRFQHDEKFRPNTLALSLKKYDEGRYSNISMLLKPAATLPCYFLRLWNEIFHPRRHPALKRRRVSTGISGRLRTRLTVSWSQKAHWHWPTFTVTSILTTNVQWKYFQNYC